MPGLLFWLRPRLDPLPIVFQAIDDLGPAGWDRLAPLGLATSKCAWQTARLAGWVPVPRWPREGPVFSESGAPSWRRLGCQCPYGICSAPEDEEPSGQERRQRPSGAGLRPTLPPCLPLSWAGAEGPSLSACRSLSGFRGSVLMGSAWRERGLDIGRWGVVMTPYLEVDYLALGLCSHFSYHLS